MVIAASDVRRRFGSLDRRRTSLAAITIPP